MRRADIEAVGELAGQGLAAGGGFIREMHEGIAARPFGVLGGLASPVRAVHDGVSRAVYTGVQNGLRRGAERGAAALATRAPDDGPALGAAPLGSFTLGVINGLYGNHMREQGSGLALGMTIRRDGRDVPLNPAAVTAAFPDATSRLAVFVHGLFGDERGWSLFPLRGRHPGRRTYGERLQDELSFTPILVRYNTGLRVSQNGRELARQLEALRSAWPTPVEEIVLIGHSMGGLVSRSACHYAERDDLCWASDVRHVFSLGSPHLGADLEKGLNALSWMFRRLPETRAIGSLLNARSVGIKDMRFGACVDEDWCDCADPDEFLKDRCTEVPFLPDAHYYFIGATLMDGPVGSALGDLLVRIPSSSGRGNGKGRRIPFEVDRGYELTGVDHMGLLNHPAVYDQLRLWLSGSGTRGMTETAKISAEPAGIGSRESGRPTA